MEPMLVRFKKSQRVIIRKGAKKLKVSEAEYIRRCIEKPALTIVQAAL